ncbi:MAG: cupin domain-containing protein [Pseudomonadota bacterium]|nr:cupin domain-containing protein [Pseudomonadota bacterium]
MSGFSINLEDKVLQNPNFRQVLYTTPRSQLVIMTLQPGEDIGQEKHEDHDQFIRVEAGFGEAILDGELHMLEDGVGLVIPAGAEHNIINTSPSEQMRLYTLYTPPEHPDGIIHETRHDADEYEKKHHG